MPRTPRIEIPSGWMYVRDGRYHSTGSESPPVAPQPL